MKRKISVITGTRADYGILRPVLREIVRSKKLQLYLIVTGMHLSRKHGLTINEIKKDGFKIHTTIKMLPSKDDNYSMANSVGEGIIKFAKVFKQLQPDINLVLGDRDEALAASIVSYHMNIPNAHIHGGDKSQAGIDEYNRHAITKISNIHFVATKKSKKRVIKMGEDPKYVFLTGSPSIDEILDNKITAKTDLEKKYGFSSFTNNEILLVYHPVTTQTARSAKQIRNILDAIIKTKRPTIAIAPNSDAGNEEIFRYLRMYSQKYDFIKIYNSIPRSDYLGMLNNCGVLIGNSSSGIIEASCFDIPVIDIGIRQKDREKSKNVLSILDDSTFLIYNTILKALRLKQQKRLRREFIYGNGTASKKITKHLEKIILDKHLIQKQIYY